MRSEEEIRERIEYLFNEYFSEKDKNSHRAGFYIGGIYLIKWVLEDTECQKN